MSNIRKGLVTTSHIPAQTRYTRESYKAALNSLSRGEILRRSSFLGVRSMENALFAASKIHVSSLLDADISYLHGMMSRLHTRGLLDADGTLETAWQAVRDTNTLGAYMEAVRTLKRTDFNAIALRLAGTAEGHLFSSYFEDLKTHVASVTISGLQTHARYLHETHRRQ